MVERLKQIPARLLEFWNKYTSKQKAVIISVIAVILLALIVLYVSVTRVEYVQINAFEDTKSSGELVELLKGENIKYKLSNDGKTVRVDSKKAQEVFVLMGQNDIPTNEIGWLDAFNNSMSTTETEKQMKFSLAGRNELRKYLLSFEGIKDAAVNIREPVNDYTVFNENKDTSVSVMLTLTDPLSPEAAKGMAKYLAGAVGNSGTDKITIIDNAGKVLFSGNEESGLGTGVGSLQEFVERLRAQATINTKEVLLGFGMDDVWIGGSNLLYNTDKVSEMYTEYSVAEGMEQGYYDNTYNYSAKGNNISGGVPGTDPNQEDTDYMLQNGNSNNEVESTTAKYLPNQRIQNIEKERGALDAEKSTLAVVGVTYKIYNQKEVEDQGLLQGITWDQFVTANNQRTEVPATDNVIALISDTTGVTADNITLSVWEQPIFNATVKEPVKVSDYLMIVLAVLIIALLLFVVFKGTAPVEVTELEPELSVEQLLATTKENQSLDDIEFSEMTETRKMIEKFVDENPEAVAQLLRNWLNDDWG